jgi:hypothetical protein
LRTSMCAYQLWKTLQRTSIDEADDPAASAP